MPANWFSIKERATAVGLVTLANLVGTAFGMILTLILIKRISIPDVQLIYGVVSLFSALVFVFWHGKSLPLLPALPARKCVP